MTRTRPPQWDGGADTSSIYVHVTAYAKRWGHVSQGRDGRYYRFRPGCLDQWLAERRDPVPVLFSHGFKRRG
jgi:phage head maturation protease